jgi:hypothetical protein
MLLNESLEIGLEILRRWERDEQNAKQLPALEFTLSDTGGMDESMDKTYSIRTYLLGLPVNCFIT